MYSLRVLAGALILVALLGLVPHAASRPGDYIVKSTLVRFANFVWVKVSVTIPSELVATSEHEVTLRMRVVEVEGELEKLYIKGVRVTLGSQTIEYVPDEPMLLKLHAEREVRVKIEPSFFAANMLPGDVKVEHMQIAFSYFLQGENAQGRKVADSGLYKAFADIPVKVVAPTLHLYVQPKVIEVMEPYMLNFTIKVWLEGGGYLENVKARIEGVPVQCDLLTTGRMSAGEERTLWTIFNISELGPLAANRYTARISVEATTPWGYTFKRSYSFTINTLKVRSVEAEIPSTVIAYAYTPVRLLLKPPPAKDEDVYVTVYSNGRQVYTCKYPTEYLVLSVSEGIVPVKIVISSEEQAPTILRVKLRAIKTTPEVEASLARDTLFIAAMPLMVSSRLTIKVYDEEGTVMLVKVVDSANLAKTRVIVDNILALSGTTMVKLNLNEAGKYIISIAYETPAGTVTHKLQYEVRAAALPLVIIIIIFSVLLAVLLVGFIVMRKKR